MAKQTVHVRGLAEMNRAFKRADKDLAKDVRSKLRDVAEPVRSEAETRAAHEIRNIGPEWSQMRTGATTRVVYVAPRKRSRGGSRRPNFAQLLMDRAMQPALEANASEIEDAVGDVLDDICRHWGR
jgi:hypothetical protein